MLIVSFFRGHEDNTAIVFASGGLAGIISWVFTYPQDVIKSRIQADSFGKKAKYSGSINCIRQSLKNEGAQVLVRGIGSTVVRAFPTNAATMGMATYVMRTVSEEKDIKVYETMARVRAGGHLQLKFSPSVEKYFERSQKYEYLPNISTLSTDGPTIIQIERARLAMSHMRLYVNNIFFAAPSKFYDHQFIRKKVISLII